METCSHSAAVPRPWFLGKLILKCHFHLQILEEGWTASSNWVVFVQKLEKDCFVAKMTVDNLSLKEALENSSDQKDLETVPLKNRELTFNADNMALRQTYLVTLKAAPMRGRRVEEPASDGHLSAPL